MARIVSRDGKKRRASHHHPNCRGNRECQGSCIRKPQKVRTIGLCGHEFKSHPCNKTWSGSKSGTRCHRCVPNKGRVDARNNPFRPLMVGQADTRSVALFV